MTKTEKSQNAPRNRLEESFDAVLHLLDRQLLDAEGRMMGNVDDLELADLGHGIEITALLTGTTAFLHRIGGRLGSRLVDAHERMRISAPDRTRPWRIPLDKVQYVDSAVHIGVRRDGLLEKGPERLRLGDLCGMQVIGDGGRRRRTKVTDARFEPMDGHLVLRALVVGRGGPGSWLGYERKDEQGPWLVAAIVRGWHRDSRVIDVDDVSIDWERRRVTVSR